MPLAMYVFFTYIITVITEVEIARRAQKQLRRMPIRIVKALQVWVNDGTVKFVSVEEVSKHAY